MANQQHMSSYKRHITFEDSVVLLEAAARNDITEVSPEASQVNKQVVQIGMKSMGELQQPTVDIVGREIRSKSKSRFGPGCFYVGIGVRWWCKKQMFTLTFHQPRDHSRRSRKTTVSQLCLFRVN